jgi:WD40 repeat protein
MGAHADRGWQALVTVWNLETCTAVHRLKLHKGKVESVCFSPNEVYLATLGGRDDGSKVVVWDLVRAPRSMLP